APLGAYGAGAETTGLRRDKGVIRKLEIVPFSRSVALIGTSSLHTPSPECQLHSRNKGARRSGVDRSRPGRGKDAAGILDARCRVDAVGNVVRGSDVGLVEHVLDLEEEDRALEIVICDLGVIVNVEIE